MKRGLEWYKRDPLAIRMAIMAAGMTDTQAAVYSLVIDLIYEGGGETPNAPQHIAAHFSNVGTAKARRAIAELVEMGKLFLVGDMIHEKRAENEAKTREKLSKNRAEIGRKGGISSGKSRAEAKENNHIDEANASSKTQADIEVEKEEEREEPPIPPIQKSTQPARKRALGASELDAEFDRIWPHYPRRVGAGAARKAWVKARSKATFEAISKPLGLFIRAIRGTPTDKIPHLATWLNGERWLDEQTHAANRPRTSTEDLAGLSRISLQDDLAALMAPPTLRLIG